MKSIITTRTENDTQDLTILQTVKEFMGITTSDEDALLSTMIRQASAAIARRCSRVFGMATITERFDLSSSSTDSLVLSRYPLDTLTAITEDGTAINPLDDTTVLSDKDSGVIYRLDDDGERTCWDASVVIVTYDAGYEMIATLPHDLEQACITQIKHMRSSASRDPMAKAVDIPGVRRTEYWVGSISKNAAELAPEVEALIAPYLSVRL